IATDDGVLLEAVVTEIHEQVGGSERTPGMQVRPNLAVAAAEAWWKARATAPADAPATARSPGGSDKAPPAPDAAGKVTVTSRRTSGQVAVPELIDDGRNTAVMEAIAN